MIWQCSDREGEQRGGFCSRSFSFNLFRAKGSTKGFYMHNERMYVHNKRDTSPFKSLDSTDTKNTRERKKTATTTLDKNATTVPVVVVVFT